MSTEPIAVTSWKTTDGRLFTTFTSAEYHQKKLDDVVLANEILQAGGSVADALRSVNYRGDVSEVLNKVTTETKLVIPHWQCQDTPGYMPIRFELGLRVGVFGNAGAWSGSYGATITTKDLSRYAEHKDTIFHSQDAPNA